MISRIRIRRSCKICGNEFTAQKTTSLYCSDNCTKRAYKQKKRDEKIETYAKEQTRIINLPYEELKAKEFLTVKEAAQLINCSVRSMYLYIQEGTIHAVNVGQRMTRIKRASIDELFAQQEAKAFNIDNIRISDCYSIAEAQDKYRISQAALYGVINRHNIPKLKQGIYTYVPKLLIDQIFN